MTTTTRMKRRMMKAAAGVAFAAVLAISGPGWPTSTSPTRGQVDMQVGMWQGTSVFTTFGIHGVRGNNNNNNNEDNGAPERKVKDIFRSFGVDADGSSGGSNGPTKEESLGTNSRSSVHGKVKLFQTDDIFDSKGVDGEGLQKLARMLKETYHLDVGDQGPSSSSSPSNNNNNHAEAQEQEQTQEQEEDLNVDPESLFDLDQDNFESLRNARDEDEMLKYLARIDADLRAHTTTNSKKSEVSKSNQKQGTSASSSTTSHAHTNNWAVLVCTSRFWFNYRHIANSLSMYRTVKRLGIPDSNIILMLPDDVACNARNHFAATVYNHASRALDLYGSNIEVDYRGYDVTAEQFVRLLTGRHDRATSRSKRLLTNERSNIFIYLTGHGGNEFIKFQDAEEISSHDIADALNQMYEKGRYNEVFLMVDSCQAASMYKRIESPGVLATASSLKGQDSYSHHADSEIGVAVIDRFTYYNLEILEKIQMGEITNLNHLFSSYKSSLIASTPGIYTDYFDRKLDDTLITDFFGGVHDIQITHRGYTLDE